MYEHAQEISDLIFTLMSLIGLFMFAHSIYRIKARTEYPQEIRLASIGYEFLASVMIMIASSFYAWSVNSVTTGSQIGEQALLAAGTNIAAGVAAIEGDGFLGLFFNSETLGTIAAFTYLLGLGAYFRGLYLIKDIGSPDPNRGGFYKPTSFMLGGFGVMNIGALGCLIGSLLNLTILCAMA